MSRGMKMILLAGALALVIGAYFALDLLAPSADGESTTVAEQTTLLALSGPEITGLTLTRDGEAVILTRRGDLWQWEGDPLFPLDQSKAAAMVAALAHVTTAQTIDNPQNLGDYGLDAPPLTVTVAAGQETHTLAFGTAGAFTNGGYYGYLDGDASTVHVLDAALFGAFNYTLYQLTQMESIPYISDGTSVTIDAPGRKMSIERIEQGASVSFTSKYNWFLREGGAYRPLATGKVTTLISTLSGTTWDSCVAYNAGPADLAQYGLDDASATRLTVGYGDNQRFALRLGRYEGGLCYAQPEGSTMVYLMDAGRADQLMLADYAALRPDDVFPVDWDMVTAFDVTWNGATRRIDIGREATDSGTRKTYSSGGQSLAQETVVALTSQLSNLVYSEIVENAESRGQLLAVTCYLDHPDFDAVTLTLGGYNSVTALADFEGERRLTVSLDTVNSLLDKLNTLFPN